MSAFSWFYGYWYCTGTHYDHPSIKIGNTCMALFLLATTLDWSPHNAWNGPNYSKFSSRHSLLLYHHLRYILEEADWVRDLMYHTQKFSIINSFSNYRCVDNDRMTTALHSSRLWSLQLLINFSNAIILSSPFYFLLSSFSSKMWT